MSSSASGRYVEGPRHAIITPDDNGPIVEIVAWVLLVLMVSATGLRLSIRFTTAHVAGRDDAVLFGGMLTGVGMIVAITIAAENGFGRHEDIIEQDIRNEMAAVDVHVAWPIDSGLGPDSFFDVVESLHQGVLGC